MVTFWHVLLAPVVTTISITLSSGKIQNGDILVPANPDPAGKIAIKWKERESRRLWAGWTNKTKAVIVIVLVVVVVAVVVVSSTGSCYRSSNSNAQRMAFQRPYGKPRKVWETLKRPENCHWDRVCLECSGDEKAVWCIELSSACPEMQEVMLWLCSGLSVWTRQFNELWKWDLMEFCRWSFALACPSGSVLRDCPA